MWAQIQRLSVRIRYTFPKGLPYSDVTVEASLEPEWLNTGSWFCHFKKMPQFYINDFTRNSFFHWASHSQEWMKKKIEVHVLVGKKGDETKTGSDNVIASKNIPIKQKIIVMH